METVNIEFTEQERQLLYQSVMTSNYPGQLAQMVLDILAKLKNAEMNIALVDSEEE